MINIRWVDAAEGGEKLDIQLEGGYSLMLDMAPLLREPRFSHISQDERILYPKTDGKAVYWPDGPRISLNEIFEMVANSYINKSKPRPLRREGNC